MADRDALITFLGKLTDAQLGQVIVRVGNSGDFDTPTLSVSARVTALVQHVESSAGPGLDVLEKHVAALFPDKWKNRSTPS